MSNDQKEMERVARQAFKAAWLFEQAARLLSDKQESASAGIPVVVNCAFSLEVYFKCLYMLEKKQYPGKKHDLRELYDGLTLASKSRIERLYTQSVSNEPKSVRLSLATVLDWAKKAFVDWRYSYERWKDPDSKSLTFANGENLCKAVREIILESKPNWKNSLRNDFA